MEYIVFTWNKDVLASNFEMEIWEILYGFTLANRHHVEIARDISGVFFINEINISISLVGWEQEEGGTTINENSFVFTIDLSGVILFAFFTNVLSWTWNKLHSFHL